MGAYAKTSPGERLTYRPSDLSKYEGEPFCLRITPEDIDLDRCFFVYLDEQYEEDSLRRLFQTFFVAPKPDQLDEMGSMLEPWLRVDPMLPKNTRLPPADDRRGPRALGRGPVLHQPRAGPRRIPEDTVRSHLGTSVFADGSFDDKILDLVLEFHTEEALPELDQWAQFNRINTSGGSGPTSRVRRRRFFTQMVMVVVAVVTFPLLIFSCRGQNNGNAGGGFGGGML